MEKQNVKGTGYLEQAMEEMKQLLLEAGIDGEPELEIAIENLMSAKIRESFRNGIEAGMNKAGGQSREPRSNRPYKRRRWIGR